MCVRACACEKTTVNFMITQHSTGPLPHPAQKMDGAHLMSSWSVFFPCVVQSVLPCLIACMLSALKAITFLMSFFCAAYHYSNCVPHKYQVIFFFSLRLWDGRALPMFHECGAVFCECRAEEWRAEAEEKSVISSVHIRVGLHVSQHLWLTAFCML